MSRRQQTTATFAVTITLPQGMNLNQMQQYLRDRIMRVSATEPLPQIMPGDFTVALTKRTTTYGN